ncbi:MAG TPA: OsmC family protein [Streptosporangiaceae bacterium]|nr:OsmC family protein [Streptosporangiaceae bacterium]
MATEGSTHRSVTISRIASTKFSVTNERGGEMVIAAGEGADFTPIELLLAAIGGCTAIDVDILTGRRSEPDAFTVRVDADKVRDAQGNHLSDIVVAFHIAFPDTPAGDDARAILPDVVSKSHDRLCSVGRTVEIGTPIATRIS